MIPQVKIEQEKLPTILVHIHQFDCVSASVFVIGIDVLTLLRGGEAQSGVVIVTAVVVTALRAADGAAGPHSDNVSSGRREASHHACNVPMKEEPVMDDCQLKVLWHTVGSTLSENAGLKSAFLQMKHDRPTIF